jgi:glyoxylase-like metal-dependent hydrolase (beta-lactamase superfamily II)
MAYVGPDVLNQLERFGIDEDRIGRIVILHSHFDHCGLVPFLKRRWPWAVVTASARSKELLQKAKVTANIAAFNQVMLARNDMTRQAEGLGLNFDGIHVEHVVGEGDKLTCDSLTLEIMAVPGHSSCSIAVYIPEERALFASDAAGVPFGDKVFTAANANFDQYQESLGRMAARDVGIHLAEHYGARSGEEARQFLQDAVADAAETRRFIAKTYTVSGDTQRTTAILTDKIMAEAPEDFLPREVVTIVAGQMVHYIAKTMSSDNMAEDIKSS